MMADEHPTMGNKSAQTLNGSPVSFMVYVEDVDAMAKQAVAAGKMFRQKKWKSAPLRQ